MVMRDRRIGVLAMSRLGSAVLMGAAHVYLLAAQALDLIHIDFAVCL
jgi:hypothetical protein